ncbi:non-canonical purine NTP pyrophosphatase [Deltaproteobacteria bacterium]|nr:non-canonical purine NTP pyrophosphatase [Deltaproteobacteria bacterium]GHU96657.1 non-canonical purine NTP pyrophosphatase [Deltaproteobacteria bacterium]
MYTRRIMLATGNADKVSELAAMLGTAMKVLGISAFPHIGEIEETGSTFEENALIKARHVAGITGLVSLADDSGIVVDVLAGAPGVYSARYADDWEAKPGENRDARNMRKLLHMMAAVPEVRRSCRFVSCIAAVRPDGTEMTIRGEWEGRVLTAPRGENGFGYDPIFLDAVLNKTAAELSRDEKNARSHRGKALRGLLTRLPTFMAVG